MKAGDLVKHKELPTMGIGLITGFKEGSSGVFVRWLHHSRSRRANTSMEADLMLEVVSEER